MVAQQLIYVSYAHSDKEIVGRLVDRLQQNGLNIWWSEMVPPGGNWGDAIEKNIQAASFMLMCVGESGFESDLQMRELELVRRLPTQLIPVSLPDFQGYQNLPAALGQTKFFDYEKESDEQFYRLLDLISPGAQLETNVEEPHSFLVVADDLDDASMFCDALLQRGHPAVPREFTDIDLPADLDRTILILESIPSDELRAFSQEKLFAVLFLDTYRPHDYPFLKDIKAETVFASPWTNLDEWTVRDLMNPDTRQFVTEKVTSPYVGARSFEPDDAHLFFGREPELEEFRRLVAGNAKVVVISGDKSSGRSSFASCAYDQMTAGGLPEKITSWSRLSLRGLNLSDRASWVPPFARTADTWGPPLVELVGDSVVVVDDFEAVFHSADDAADAFVDELCDAIESNKNFHAVLVVESGYYEELQRFERLVSPAETVPVHLEPMDEGQLRSAADGPAHLFDLTVNEDLLDRVVRDAMALPSPITALSASMHAVWKARSGYTLTLEDYERLGGAEEILEQAKAEKTSRDRPGRIQAGFFADKDDVDRLNITPIVEAMCSVVLSRNVDPPLSIGLFGDWGSGKTFFIDEMKRSVSSLARQAREEDSTHWHGHVAQITFNAWHYSDANLWASFVTHIFDELSKIINPGEGLHETRAKLLEGLETSKTLKAEAQQQLDDSQKALSESKKDLRDRKDEYQTEQRRLRAVRIGDIKYLLGVDNEGEESGRLIALKELSESLGIDDIGDTVGELGNKLAEARSLFGQVRAVWTNMRKAWGKARALTALAIAIVLFVVAVTIIPAVFDQQSPWLVSAAALIANFLIVLGGLFRFVGPVRDKLAELNKAFESLTEEADRREQTELAAQQAAVASAQAKVTEAEEALARADRRVSEAEEAVRDASASRRFYRFVEERSASEDYKKHLGLISSVHRDFKELGKLLEDLSEYRTRGQQTSDDQETRIDRIVLYIDDLDRCQPELVVQVLQAVHLLLALPLFVVVVGVDARWLLRALEVYYPEFLATPRKPDENERIRRHAATPQNYLEKIFQIPFCLPGMEKTGFGNLITHLAQNRSQELEDTGDEKREPVMTVQAVASEPDADEREEEKADPAPPEQNQEKEEIKKETDTVEPQTRERPDPTPEPARPPMFAVAIEISSDEQDFMKKLHPLIGTPRATKRFVNVYRLLRAVSVDEDGKLIESDYRVSLTMLAVNVGSPHLGRKLFNQVQKANDGDSWTAFVNKLEPKADSKGWSSPACGRITEEEAVEWQRIIACLNTLSDLPPKLVSYKHWITPISRFAFWPPGHA